MLPKYGRRARWGNPVLPARSGPGPLVYIVWVGFYADQLLTLRLYTVVTGSDFPTKADLQAVVSAFPALHSHASPPHGDACMLDSSLAETLSPAAREYGHDEEPGPCPDCPNYRRCARAPIACAAFAGFPHQRRRPNDKALGAALDRTLAIHSLGVQLRIQAPGQTQSGYFKTGPSYSPSITVLKTVPWQGGFGELPSRRLETAGCARTEFFPPFDKCRREIIKSAYSARVYEFRP